MFHGFIPSLKVHEIAQATRHLPGLCKLAVKPSKCPEATSAPPKDLPPSLQPHGVIQAIFATT